MPELIELLTPRDAAKVLRTSYGPLAKWRSTRKYPLRYVRLGGKIYYKLSDVRAFIDARIDPGTGPAPVARKRRKAARR